MAGRQTPMMRPVVPCNTARRETLRGIAMALARQRIGRVLDGGADADIGGATADIAAHGLVDVAIGRPLHLAQERHSAHHLPRLAIPALRNLSPRPAT